jgi:DNA invertase Pin-like site-specific DNA recombinase
MQKLLEDSRLRPRKFDVVVAEALDRLSRDQEDIAAVFKRLGHVDVRYIRFPRAISPSFTLALKEQ